MKAMDLQRYFCDDVFFENANEREDWEEIEQELRVVPFERSKRRWTKM